MTNASQPFLDPEVVARVSNLELRARQIVEGMLSGRHRSPLFGHSVEFAQHREYVPGDDLRRLDWKVWAKADRLYVKQYEEETNLRATIVLDASASMDYGAGDKNKYAYSCQLAATLAFLLLRQSDAVGLFAFDESLAAEVPHRNPQNHLRTILASMKPKAGAKKTHLEPVLKQIAERESRRGLMVIVSDLLAERQSVLKGLKVLHQRRHDVIVLHVLHDDEIDFLFEGTTRFEGMEDTHQLTCDPRALRADYVAAMEKYLADLRKFAAQTGVDYRLVRTSHPIDAVLASLLHERTRSV